MATNAFFGTRTITAAATAVSISAAIRGTAGSGQAPAYAGSGIGVSLNFYADKDIYVGTDSTVTDSANGALLPANTPFSDSGTGMGGNAVDITQLFVYSAGTNATLTVFYRAPLTHFRAIDSRLWHLV
jgi:hypothetical protein